MAAILNASTPFSADGVELASRTAFVGSRRRGR
jgi:hypothetical protein